MDCESWLYNITRTQVITNIQLKILKTLHPCSLIIFNSYPQTWEFYSSWDISLYN
jgi:hypothetical protein